MFILQIKVGHSFEMIDWEKYHTTGFKSVYENVDERWWEFADYSNNDRTVVGVKGVWRVKGCEV